MGGPMTVQATERHIAITVGAVAITLDRHQAESLRRELATALQATDTAAEDERRELASYDGLAWGPDDDACEEAEREYQAELMAQDIALQNT